MKNRFFPNLRRIYQKTPSHCGPAVVEMLLSFWHQRVGQEKVVLAARAKEKLKSQGITISEMANAVRTLAPDFRLWFKNEAQIEDLSELVLERGIPAGVEWQGVFGKDSDGDDGHYSIVTNIDRADGLIYISDPYKKFAGKDRVFSLQEFETRWWDTNEIFTPDGKMNILDYRMVFIIIPKDEIWPESFGMIRG